MNRARARWQRVRCLIQCIVQFAHTKDALSPIDCVTLPFEPGTWHRHKLERFQNAYNKDPEYRTDVDLKLLMEIVQSVAIFSHASYACKLGICRNLHTQVLHDGEVVYYEGDIIDASSGVFVVLDGVVSIYKNPSFDVSLRLSYSAWHQAKYPNDEMQFGTCVKTATVGHSFGETAIHGFLFRQYTVLAQSRTKVAVLNQSDYRRILSFNDMKWDPQPCLYTIETEPTARTAVQIQNVVDFLYNMKLFRSQPREVVELVSHRLCQRTFKANDVVSRQSDPTVKMVVVVSGRLLLYMADTSEELRCRGHSEQAPIPQTPKKVVGGVAALAERVEYDAVYGWCVGELKGGECFGEQALAYHAMESATLRAAATSTAILLSQTDLDEAIAEHTQNHEAGHRKPPNELSHLMQLMQDVPATRPAGVVRTIQAALLRCDARLFFGQFTAYALEIFARESTIRVVSSGTVLLEQDHTCEHMFVILEGSVNIHRLTARRKQRRRSSLIRAELHHELEKIETKPVGQESGLPVTATTFGTEILERCGQYLGSIPVGGAFGHALALTNSHSQSSYVVSRNLSKGSVTATLLCLPARFVKPLLQARDEYLLYNPRQVLDQATKPKDQLNSTLKLSYFLSSKPTFAALPQRTLMHLLDRMTVVEIPHNRLLWDQGEKLFHGVVIVLSGSIMLVRSSRRPTTIEPIFKATDNAEHKLVLNVTRTANTVTLMNSHDQVHTCGPGDCIGSMRFGETDAEWTTIKPETAMTLTECKIAIVQWPKGYGPEADVAKQCHDILQFRETQLLQLQDRVASQPDDPIPGKEDIDAAITHLLSMLEWKNRFPVPVQAYVAELFTFETFPPNETPFYIILSGHVNVFVQRRKRHANVSKVAAARRDNVGRRLWQDSIRKTSTMDSKDEMDPMKAIQALTKDKQRPSEQSKRILQFASTYNNLQDNSLGELEARLGVGDVLGEQALFCPGTRHRCSVVTATDTSVIMLTRGQYEHLLVHGRSRSSPVVVVRNSSERAKDLWKLVIHYIVKNRSQRSHWPSVIAFARQKRIRLIMDIVKDVPAFQVIPPDVRVKICERTLFQTYDANAVGKKVARRREQRLRESVFVVFERGKHVERFFVIVSGCVDLFHVSSQDLPLADDSDSGALKIRSLRDGDWFGEYEILTDDACRHVMAVSPDGVRLVAIHKTEFLASWPTLNKMKDRLAFLRQSDALGALEDDRLCSVWYGIRRQKFRRNDIVVPERHHKVLDAIYWIEDGECVVYQHSTLSRSVKERRSKERDVELEMQVATLSRGNILYCDEATWKRSSLVASSQVVHIFVLTYASPPNMLHRIVGKRGMSALRRIMRVENEFQQSQQETARQLATKSEPKPIESTILPLLKCAPVSRMRGNRMKLPHFLLQRHVATASMEMTVPPQSHPENDEREQIRPATHCPLSHSTRMSGSFTLSSPMQSSVAKVDSPRCFSPLETAQILRPKIQWEETENPAIRLQKALNLQIHEEARLVQALGFVPTIKQKASRDAEALRTKHGRPSLCPRTASRCCAISPTV
ncbi:unnamed protein product [Aphanomyces euteiches]